MKLVRNWIEDFIDASDLTNEQMAETLTSIGHAVEGIESHGDLTVFDIDFTTNRIDAMSHRGVARELAGALSRDMKNQPVVREATAAGKNFTIRIESPEMCSRFSALLITGVEVKPSSPAVQARLEAVGLRPINNVVDTTNYVMMALGHPLHAYDFDLVEKQTLIARAGKQGESVECLDDITRKITPETVVIADGGRAVGLGGVIGGANTEISDSTKNVLLECAHFTPSVIRSTARNLGVKTDASYRFERGIDPNDTVASICAAADHILSEAGGTWVELVDVVARPIEPITILLRDERLRMFADGTVGRELGAPLLVRLEMGVKAVTKGIEVTIPTWRGDIEQEIDLVEEVLRFHGYNNVTASLPRLSTGDTEKDEICEAEERLRDLLCGMGLVECINYSFIHPDHNRLFTAEEPLDISNALTENTSSMRLSLLPGLIGTVQHNLSYGIRDGGIFEVGRSYHRSTGDGIVERSRAGIVLFGLAESHWGDGSRSWDFFDLKGMVEEVCRGFRASVEVEASDGIGFGKGQAAKVRSGERTLAILGNVSREVLDRLGVKGQVLAGEIFVDDLVSASADWKMQDVSRFPGVPMVLRLMHDPDVAFGRIVEQIRKLDVPYLAEVGIWDRFSPSDSDRVKTTLGMWYQALDRSLTQDEVTAVHASLASEVSKLLDVEIVE